MNRLLATTIVALFLIAPTSPAQARTTWEAHTKGSPVATEFGRWTEVDRKNVRLDFLGGHLLGEHTTFTATWRTPWISGDAARFEAEYEITNVNEVGAAIPMSVGVRSRFRGSAWSKWFSMKRTLRPGLSRWGGGMGSIGVGASGTRMQFEWRLEGTISAPTYLGGSASMFTS